MKMNLKNYLGSFLAAATVVTACAVEEETPANRDEKAYFDAWIHVNYPDAEYCGFGIYILEDNQVEGEAQIGESGYAFVTYTLMDLKGNVSTTSDYGTAKKVGGSLFHESYYYGPNVWTLGEGAQHRGVSDMLSSMTVGGWRKVAIPGWLRSYQAYETEQEYIDNVTGNLDVIYEVKVRDWAEDITQWELDSLARFNDKYLGLADSTSYGFYYKTLTAGEGEVETLHADTTIYINYTGRLLNGQVFDTTIEDTAKVYNIYNTSKTYEPVSISMSDEMSEITMGDDDNSIITGFRQTLWQMKAFEKGVGVFYSGLGYSNSGSGNLIPAYAPLIFEIEIVEDPDE